jgi:hypothetical protein
MPPSSPTDGQPPVASARHGKAFLVLDVFGDLFLFMRERKKYWLPPEILIMLMVPGALIMFAQGAAVAPFIYTPL